MTKASHCRFLQFSHLFGVTDIGGHGNGIATAFPSKLIQNRLLSRCQHQFGAAARKIEGDAPSKAAGGAGYDNSTPGQTGSMRCPRSGQWGRPQRQRQQDRYN